LLAGGILGDNRAAAAVAAGAAVVAGFGAFKSIRCSPGFAMALATAGMAVSALTGTLAGQTEVTLLLVVLLWGFGAGLLSALEANLGWVGQQCTIVLMVAAAFPGGPEQATYRTLLVLGGSLLQLICIEGIRRLFGVPARFPSPTELRESARATYAALRTELGIHSASTQRALSLAVVLAATVEAWRGLHLPNGYWMAMTVLLLVKPDFRGTIARGVERVLGTVVGAALATVIAVALPHSSLPWAAASLTASFALLTLLLQQGNRIGPKRLDFPGSYALFAMTLTAYIVFLLDYAGWEERAVAANRVLFTVLGGVFALAVHLPLGHWRPRLASGADGNRL
jgi:hypothetical protein